MEPSFPNVACDALPSIEILLCKAKNAAPTTDTCSPTLKTQALFDEKISAIYATTENLGKVNFLICN